MDKVLIYEWPAASLTSNWKPLEEFHAIQQVDWVPRLFEVSEHRARLYFHRLTGETIAAPLPQEVTRAGLVGPRLSALIAYQKGACRMAYRVFQRYLDSACRTLLSIPGYGGQGEPANPRDFMASRCNIILSPRHGDSPR